ncbi:MAG: zinc-binding dehydrogenase [Acidobacteriota bacterium]|nr:zinc-binding dehydrogenase [Acidobacteriota bacterium]
MNSIDSAQAKLLNNVAALVDTGRVRHTMVQKLVGINADTIRQAHEIVASAKMIGKIVISRD